MSSYRVTFYRDVLGDQGHPFRSALRSISISAAKSRERAVAAALRRFERREGLSDWRDLAHGYELDEMGGEATDREGDRP